MQNNEIKASIPQAMSSRASKTQFLSHDEAEKMIQAGISDAIQQAKEHVQKVQDSFFAIFGIWASILSFLTIEFQFLKTLSHVGQIIGFTLILFSLLLSFNLALDCIVTSRSSQKPRTHWVLMLLIAIAFLIGIFFIAFAEWKLMQAC